ncbi:MAG: UbiA family prenyltransferase [Chloroflexia bacterium]
MSRLRPWLQLLHFGPSLLTTLAFGVYIALAAHGLPPAGPLTLLLASQLAAQFAISLLNDYWDLPADRLTKPDKPIPSGLISAVRVRVLGWATAASALALALPLGRRVLACAVVGLGAGLLYDLRLKRTTLSYLPFALGFGVLPLWAWAGVGRAWDATVWWGAALTAWLVLPLHLADTLPDLEADAAIGLRGLAHLLGPARALAVCRLALLAGLCSAALLGIAFHAAPLTLAVTLAVGAVLLLASIALHRLRGDPALRRMAGLIEAASLLTSLGWLAAVA